MSKEVLHIFIFLSHKLAATWEAVFCSQRPEQTLKTLTANAGAACEDSKVMFRTQKADLAKWA